jgi:hypothetical protein
VDAFTFDDLAQMNYGQPRKPFFAIDLANEQEVHNWLKEELNYLHNENINRLEKIKNNYLRYKGIQYMNQVYQPRDVPETRKKYMPQMVLPFIADAVDEKTARLLEVKPNVVVMPVHDEQKDKTDAKIAKRFLSHIDYVQKIDSKMHKFVRNSKLAGESYLWVRWNPDLGDAIKLKPVQDSDTGRPQQETVFNGDVEIKHMTPHWTFYEKAAKFEDVNYVFFIELDYTEGMKRDYPQVKDKIRQDGDTMVMDYNTMEEKYLRGTTRKITFYHKRTKYMPQGYECVFTMDAVLKSGPLSYAHGKLPMVRLIDVENDEELYGEPHIEKVRSISSQINNMLNAAVKMTMLAGWAKWFVEAGSIDEQQLNNDVSVVKVKAGTSKPVLAQANPVGAGHFDFMEKLSEMFYSFSKSNSVVRGEPPTGVTAFVALQYVSESESRRMNTDVANLNSAVRDIYDMILQTAGQFYQPNDERTMMILGKDGRWDQLPLDPTTLAKPYSVMIQNASGLSDSKAIRTQQIVDLNQEFPGMFQQQQVAEMLDLGQGDKFLDTASAAARSAEQENEQMQDGNGVIQPAEWEEHITHWRIHVASMQSMGFKMKAGPKIINDMADHIRATEMLMMDMAMKNPGYFQLIAMQLPQFPIFMAMPPMPPPPPPEQGNVPHGTAPQKKEQPKNINAPGPKAPGAAPPPNVV